MIIHLFHIKTEFVQLETTGLLLEYVADTAIALDKHITGLQRLLYDHVISRSLSRRVQFTHSSTLDIHAIDPTFHFVPFIGQKHLTVIAGFQ